MASVIWRYPWMRMRISSGSDMIGRSRDQNACDSRRLSRATRSWPIGERPPDILAGDWARIGSDPKGRDVACVVGFRPPETTAREDGQRASQAAAASLRERSGNSEDIVVNRQGGTHEHIIASPHHRTKCQRT